jgi:hypothetical protein
MKIFSFNIEKIKAKYQTCEHCPEWNYMKTEYRVWSDEHVSVGWCKKLGRITDLKNNPVC